MEITTNSPEQTRKVATVFAKDLKLGDIVMLYGDLGSGKTQFFKGLAKGLGIKQRVTSPTFVFLKIYNANGKTINHIDLYRSENISDLREIGLDEIFESSAITVIEWADRLEDNLPKKRIDIFITPVGETSRKITIFPKIPQNPNLPSIGDLKKAARVLKNGGVVIFPTDTVYGIGCIYNNKEGLQRIYKIKNRPQSIPFPILVSSIDQAKSIADMNSLATSLAEKYWPGGLTIIVKSKESGDKIGIRMPDSKYVKSLIEKTGEPIIGTSANFHGQKSVANFELLDYKIIKLVDYVLKGECEKGIESTVVDTTGEKIKVIRQGVVKIN